ncbi:GlcG/HbpS family heme-binding protein [Verminephrobacter eiseniae]|uniref:GlcG/HbpS family heme-binding protein n=1 Tax=Verminephrobacter eiseniae TaxID=364317 RepID=UPI0010D6D76F|nr:heme-binding protein [Verminephrobacter eiseniae]KAB7628850.1 heme-binding protein [Verminephrobacter sp. Larva24]MCW5230180.1 heme-binding protein [Verminephrobacter eiseniae]MCW5291913.1 heme-binding protein [Verminephrobacter eiseniae]MCW8184934.1 heme-binding protein [Verminephrobacter eiseniae]MCW8223638.1 heme-binding protein [Verminephrobacter eiseniae]
MNLSVETPQIGTTAAHAAVAAAVNHARSLGITINAAVTDGSGTLMAFLRMNGAFLHSIDIALDKAYTAASFGLPTSKWSGVIGDDELLRIGLNRRERLVLFGGGLPIVSDGARIGGIGVSGGSAEQDEACARAGLQALGLV